MIVCGNEIGEWVSEKIGSVWFNQGTYCIGDIRENIVSGVIFKDFNGSSVVATMATDGSFSRKFIKEIHNYAFDYLKVNCVISFISEDNLKSNKLVKRLGFRFISLIPGAMKKGNMYIYALYTSDRKYHG